jgi:methylthioribose-1-phosphate isomerase
VSGSDELCSLRWNAQVGVVEVIDQTLLPHTLHWCQLDSLAAFCRAISSMQVRGAPLIGITAAFGLARALAEDASTPGLERAAAALLATRPTAVNLHWALDKVTRGVCELEPAARADAALAIAMRLRAEDIAHCAAIGEHGLRLFQALKPAGPLNVMTHCNAGWLATIAWGTALAPVYKAHAAGMAVHVWVSETRPRNQGMNLTAWELQRAGVPYTIVADNSCGRLLQCGEVDCVIVGSDRTAANGDVCNKIGTYLKALGARACGVPFYVALPESTVDWSCADGEAIPIEDRDELEVLTMSGVDTAGEVRTVGLACPGGRARNPAFDVTPAGLVDALVTEHGVFETTGDGMAALRAQIFSSSPI